MFLLKLFEAMSVIEMSADTYKSAEKLLRKKQRNVGNTYRSIMSVPGAGDAMSKLSAKHAKLSGSLSRVSGGIASRVKAGIEKHRPKIMGGSTPPPVSAAPKKPGAAAEKLAIRTPSTEPRKSTYKPPKKTAAPQSSAPKSSAPQSSAPAGSSGHGWHRVTPLGKATLGAAAAYGGYKVGKFIHRKYKQWRGQL